MELCSCENVWTQDSVKIQNHKHETQTTLMMCDKPWMMNRTKLIFPTVGARLCMQRFTLTRDLPTQRCFAHIVPGASPEAIIIRLLRSFGRSFASFFDAFGNWCIVHCAMNRMPHAACSYITFMNFKPFHYSSSAAKWNSSFPLYCVQSSSVLSFRMSWTLYVPGLLLGCRSILRAQSCNV